MIEILSLSLLIIAITIYDELLNGKWEVTQKLWEWMQKQDLAENSSKE